MVAFLRKIGHNVNIISPKQHDAKSKGVEIVLKKRLFALLLTLALMFSLSAAVLAASVNDFTDVPQNIWYRDAVDYVVQRGYMVGASANRFNPDGGVTRAQICQVLYAMNDKPIAGTTPKFSDVSADAWYAAAINWCYIFGVISGYPDGTFHPSEYVTREQLCCILYQYSIKKGYCEEGAGANVVLAGFPDVNDISGWAYEGLAWCVMKGVISGSNKGLEPQKVANRAQIAAILRSYDQKVRFA